MLAFLQIVVGGFLGGGLASFVAYRIHRGEVAAKMVELAVDVLASDPPGQPALRKWAAKLLAHYSPVKLDEEAQRELRDKFIFSNVRGERALA